MTNRQNHEENVNLAIYVLNVQINYYSVDIESSNSHTVPPLNSGGFTHKEIHLSIKYFIKLN